MKSNFTYQKRIALFVGILLSIFSQLAAEEVSGTLTDLNPSDQTITLSVDGDSKRYSVSRGDALIYKPGDKIRGTSAKVGNQNRLQTIWPNDSVTQGILVTFAQRLRKDTRTRGSKAFRGIGEYLPKFALLDQNGELYYSETAKGKYLVLNFIFTRCTVPTMCPAATERMTQLQRMAKEQGIDNLQLISITLDPEYDTPGIFKAYELDKEIDPANFKLLGGNTNTVEDLKTQLGVLAEKDPDQIIKHTLTTTLIDPTGKVIYRIPGSMWDPQIFLKQIQKDQEN